MGPRILIAGPGRLDDYLSTYCEALRLVDAEPVRDWPDLRLAQDESSLGDWLGRFAGLVLPGGDDVEPHRYGAAPHPKLGKTDPELDEGQLALARLALRRQVPTLAICRGIQVLAVAAGGALYQDLPSERPSDVPHQVRTTRETLAHEVVLEPESRLATHCGATRFLVNSRHHQAVRLPEGGDSIGPLGVVARAPDGLVEGLELAGHPFFVGVQWHPENLVGSLPEARGLFRGLVSACRHATCYEDA